MTILFFFLTSFLLFQQYLQPSFSYSLLDKTIQDTNTIIYLLLSSHSHRLQNIQKFLLQFNLTSNSYILYPSVQKDKLMTKSLDNLLKTGYINEEWVQKYLINVGRREYINNFGRLALALTVHDVFTQFKRSKYQNILLFEDDVIINKSYQSDIHLFIKLLIDYLTIPSNKWDGQYLGFCYECGNKTNYNEIYSLTPLKNRYYEAVIPRCTHALYLNRHYVETYLTYSLPLPQNKGDWIFHQISCQYKLKIIRPPISLFQQDVSKRDSSLGNNDDKIEFGHWISCAIEKEQCLNLSKVNSSA